MANARIHGYGSQSFGRNLRQCYERLAERAIGEDDLVTVMGFAERILGHPIELIDGVRDTLEYLSERHELTLFTKGHPDEQTLKIDRSGLVGFFAHTAVVHEKDAAAYAQLVHARALILDRSWMVGNSSKSDINPALAIGLNAVFITHTHTWVLERQEIRPGRGRRAVIEQFRDLGEDTSEVTGSQFATHGARMRRPHRERRLQMVWGWPRVFPRSTHHWPTTCRNWRRSNHRAHLWSACI